MRYFTYIIRLMVVVAALATLYAGLIQGDWGETVLNATLL